MISICVQKPIKMLIILYIAKLFSFVFFPGRLDIKVRLVDFVKLTYDVWIRHGHTSARRGASSVYELRRKCADHACVFHTLRVGARPRTSKNKVRLGIHLRREWDCKYFWCVFYLTLKCFFLIWYLTLSNNNTLARPILWVSKTLSLSK